MNLMNTRKNEIDMLHGPLAGKILRFALPLAASSVLQQLFNAADLAVVGRFASSQAMAAVGSNGSVVGLLINLFVGLSVGANVVIGNLLVQAMALGEIGSIPELRRVVAASFENEEYRPEGDPAAWDAAYARLLKLTK